MGFFSNLDIEIRNAWSLQCLTEMLKEYNIEEGCDLYSQCVEAWNKYREEDEGIESPKSSATDDEAPQKRP